MMKNGRMSAAIGAAAAALFIAVVGWLLVHSAAASSAETNMRERITKSETKIQAIEKWQDKVDDKLEAIHQDVKALRK